MTSPLQQRLDALIPLLRSAGTDMQHVEVKDASGGFPPKLLRSVSAFANSGDGLLVLGLAEPDFVPTRIDARQVASTLASKCSDNLVPPIRPEIEICTVNDVSVVVAAVEELDGAAKPCLVGGEGSEAYVRSHDGDRRITGYEHHALLAAKGQPNDDEQPVDGTDSGDLDPNAVSQFLRRVRETRGPVFRDADDIESLRLLGVLTDAPQGLQVTLAGLLALGRYPQQYFPRLSLTFVAFATTTGGSATGRHAVLRQPSDRGIRARNARAGGGRVAAKHEPPGRGRRSRERRLLGVSARGGPRSGDKRLDASRLSSDCGGAARDDGVVPGPAGGVQSRRPVRCLRSGSIDD